jgi:glycosyltransferase involved in cell wall biosynthesis
MKSAQEKLRVAVNAQLAPDGGAGGIETALRALGSVARLDDGPEEYVFVGHWREPEWLRPWVGSRARIVPGRPPESPAAPRRGWSESVKSALGPLRPAARSAKSYLLSSAARRGRGTQPPPGNLYERLGCDVVHFPFQHFEPCAVPTVFNPHDLQHLHFPDFFSAEEIGRREATYRAACREAHTVVVASEFVRDDLLRQYGLEPGKVQVIPWAPPPAPEPGPDRRRDVREKYGLRGEPFALYPAMTWEHKNHRRLLEALALLRDRDGLKVNLVCTGQKTAFWPEVERRLSELRLEDRARFLGMVAYEDLRAVYQAAQFVIVPTLFEAASAPLFEAWQAGAPVACAAVTSLPEQAADAALLFDPLSVEAIAAAAGRMATDEELREDLRRRGLRRLQDFSLERTARAYRAVYRRAAGRRLDEEDRLLLGQDRARAAAHAEAVRI